MTTLLLYSLASERRETVVVEEADGLTCDPVKLAELRESLDPGQNLLLSRFIHPLLLQ